MAITYDCRRRHVHLADSEPEERQEYRDRQLNRPSRAELGKTASRSYAGHMIARVVVALCVSACAIGCGRDDSPMRPSRPSTVAIGAVAPPSGSTLAPVGTPPGAFFPRLSGMFGVTISVTAGEKLSFAQLNVYLLTTDSSNYCGQNLPDSPTWRPFQEGDTVTYTVTGFQVYRLPCEVTAIRAIFHTRDDSHVGGIPPSSQIVADTTLPAVFHFR